MFKRISAITVAASMVLALGASVLQAQGQRDDQGERGPSDLNLQQLKKGGERSIAAADQLVYAHQWGAYDLGTTPDSIFIRNTGFPGGNKGFHEKLTFVAPYQDPSVAIFKGDLYEVTVGGAKRYLLFCDTDVQGTGRRYIVAYRDDGARLWYDVANVAKK